ncbi:UPF0547 protein C16orf87 homolog [Tribolium castaneum]|uniref:UPF0547 protein C16orf87 homolog-like Protein n=1 Tax=Tribolium castaneum TaxID=7070 RepID=D6W749_TRICA|nr:PREDICTED: UPF0547 protein C16orf87 homolog [Tribolium castaneum]EFA11507.1 UPF0547 protein C16orf87 homolog-like Protein [Tribolium castaneum]|eukprot:XP_001814386.1 PREDICTED: UPF0547 protein C16orf87 homolog [Tribolium castaneum]
MIAKNCPKCDQQVPVACKACPCGHSFFNSRRTARVLSPGADIRRRTQRVRREKPNYYDALEYDKQIRKIKTRNSECENDDEGGKKDPSKIKRKKVKKEEDEDDDVITNLSAEKQVQCSIILEELNRKMQMVTWKPT